jgi:photosystem II stability/assembly factor-like uncharacterized protein
MQAAQVKQHLKLLQYLMVFNPKNNNMKKQLYLFVCIIGLLINSAAQTDNWIALNTGYPLNYGISRLIVKKNCIYVFNSHYSTLIRSLDKGNSWDFIQIPSDSLYHEYTDMVFVNDSVGYLSGYDGSMFSGFAISSVVKKTTNKGLTWQTTKNGITNNSILTHISFFNENIGYAFGTAQMETKRFATVNGGLNWIPVNYSQPVMDQVNYSNYTSNAEGVVSGVGHYMHIATTQDQGSTWTTKHFHDYTSPSGIKFFDSQNGIVVADDYIYSTNDGATTFFSEIKFPYSNFIKSFDMIDMQKGFFCTNTSIYYTADAGATWKLSYTNPNIQLVTIKIEGNAVFATTCGTNLILKLDISEILSSLAKNNINQNAISIYPNPANDRITIVSDENEKLIRANITDQLGRLVKSVDLTEIKTIDTKELNQGAYQIEVLSGKKISVKKLIICKN